MDLLQEVTIQKYKVNKDYLELLNGVMYHHLYLANCTHYILIDIVKISYLSDLLKTVILKL